MHISASASFRWSFNGSKCQPLLLSFQSIQSIALISDWRNAVISTQTNQIKITKLVVSCLSSLPFSLTAHYCAATDAGIMMSFRPGTVQDNGVMDPWYDEGSSPCSDTGANYSELHFVILSETQRLYVCACLSTMHKSICPVTLTWQQLSCQGVSLELQLSGTNQNKYYGPWSLLIYCVMLKLELIFNNMCAYVGSTCTQMYIYKCTNSTSL